MRRIAHVAKDRVHGCGLRPRCAACPAPVCTTVSKSPQRPAGLPVQRHRSDALRDGLRQLIAPGRGAGQRCAGRAAVRSQAAAAAARRRMCAPADAPRPRSGEPQPRKFAEVYKMGAKLGSGGAPPAPAPRRARVPHSQPARVAARPPLAAAR